LNQNTRQRITGTIVLAVTALVLLPIIFDGQGSYQVPLQTDIPVRPSQPDVSRTFPQRPVITADTDEILIRPVTPELQSDSGSDGSGDLQEADANDELAEASSVAAAAPAPEPVTPTREAAAAPAEPGPALDARGLPEAWSVRLGAFSSQANATNLIARLQQAGHRAYTRRVSSSQGELTAVFVGPLIDRAAAQSLMESLRQDFQLNGLIVRYEIDEL
jgi:DedD protein